MKILRIIKGQLSKLKTMVLSDAPAWLILTHFKLNYLHRLSSSKKIFLTEQYDFRQYAKTLKLDNDWFSPNIPTWLMAFQKQSYNKKTLLKCMEIGSWQGQSAVFLLSYFDNDNLTCVDTWEKSVNESDIKMQESIDFRLVEKNFDNNIK